jgi:pimeloyl-ACP methyl ester carboxylesterase
MIPDTSLRPPLATLKAATGDAQPPMAFIHGMISSHALWTRAGRSAQVRRRAAVLVPLPGHHPWIPSPTECRSLLTGDALIDAYADALAERFAGAPVVLVGHSTGVLIALEIAYRRPELVDSVFAAAGLSDGDLGGQCSMAARLSAAPIIGDVVTRALLWRWLGGPRQFAAGLDTALSRAETQAPSRRRPPRRMLRDLRRGDPGVMRRFGLWLLRRSLRRRMKAIQTPVCLLVCASDPVVPPKQQLAMAGALPNANAIVLDSGHLPMFAHPEQFMAALDSWLGERSGAALRRRARPTAPRAAAEAAESGLRLSPMPQGFGAGVTP